MAVKFRLAACPFCCNLESHEANYNLDLAGMMFVCHGRAWIFLASQLPRGMWGSHAEARNKDVSNCTARLGTSSLFTRIGFPKFACLLSWFISIFNLQILTCICLVKSVSLFLPVEGRPQLLLFQLPAIHIFHCKSFNSIFGCLANPEHKSQVHDCDIYISLVVDLNCSIFWGHL